MKPPTQRYTRKPFRVEVTQVTAGNIADVAEWCGGQVISTGTGYAEAGGVFIKVPVKQKLAKDTAYVGDWIVRSGNSFRAYTHELFLKTFVPDPISTPINRNAA